MNGGDRLRVHMHDTWAGYRVDIYDLTTHQHGSMTASKANGFGQILFQPKANACHVRPYAFHPMYNSAVKRGTTWTAHTYNVAASDEIGHFEYCNAADPNTGECTSPGAGDPILDADDEFCLDGSQFASADPDRRLRPRRRGLRRAELPARLARLMGEAEARRQGALDAVPVHVADDGRQAARERLVRDRPGPHRAGRAREPAHAVRRPTGANCTNPPSGRSSTRSTRYAKSGGKCMVPAGRRPHPGTRQLVRRRSKTEYGTCSS